jgi:aromatic-L-amino-acid/L-tryptophan decarboxylase
MYHHDQASYTHAGQEATLDPTDWREFRDLAHRMLDDMMDYLYSVRSRPAWQAVPEEVKQRLQEPVPWQGTDASTVYDQFRRDILPYPSGNLHPRFWGWARGTGTPLAMMAEMLAAGLNSHVAGGDHSATVVEEQVIRWLAEMIGYAKLSGGLLVTGTTVANLIGLGLARHAKAGYFVRERGLQALNGSEHYPALLIYASTEAHSSIQRGCELLGIGNQGLRRVPVKESYEIDLLALRNMIKTDQALGHRPICVVGNAGTVNTGAIDDLGAVAAFCRENGLWFHVDGAFGALAALSPKLRPKLRGLEEADSIAFDLHKWGYLPYDVGCILVRDPIVIRSAFALSPDYLAPTDRGLATNPLAFSDLGIQHSRSFRALKVWMSLKTHGASNWARLIEQNVEHAGYLARRIAEHYPELELLVPVSLNIVCFRYAALHLNESQLRALNAEILLRIQERGIAVFSSTILSGNRFALRVANTNHRSRAEDFDVLVRAVLEEGRKLATGTTYKHATKSSADAMQGWNLTDPGVNGGFSKPQSEIA